MLSDERQLDFCRALSTAVRSGLPLSDAFETLSKSRAYGRLMAGAAKLTSGGTSLYEALDAQGIFPPVFIALLRAGEESGKADEFLDLYSGCLEVRVEFRRRIGRVLIYPASAVILAGALFLIIFLKVVPMLMEPLLSAGVAVPGPTLWLTARLGLLQGRWPLVLVFAVISWLALRAFMRSGPGRNIRALAGHWLPGFRFATEHARFYHIYMTMALLLKAGVTLGAMMDILLQFSQDDPVAHRRFLRASALLSGGKSFSGSLDACIPPEDKCAMEIAEKAGRLEGTMLRLAKAHYDLHSHRLKVLVKVCTISAMAALAPLCFLLIMSLIWPVFSALSGVKELTPDSGPSGRNAILYRAPSPNGGRVQRNPPGEETVEDPETESFNELHGKKVTEFIQKHAPKDSQAADSGRQTGRAGARKFRPMPSIKNSVFPNIKPAFSKPADPGGSGTSGP